MEDMINWSWHFPTESRWNLISLLNWVYRADITNGPINETSLQVGSSPSHWQWSWGGRKGGYKCLWTSHTFKNSSLWVIPVTAGQMYDHLLDYKSLASALQLTIFAYFNSHSSHARMVRTVRPTFLSLQPKNWGVEHLDSFSTLCS